MLSTTLSTIITSFKNSNIISFLTISIIIYVARFYYNYFTRPNPLPGPFPLPLIGNAHQPPKNKYNDWLLSLHKKYGDIFEIHLAGQRVIYLCKKDLVEKMKVKYAYRLEITEGMIDYGFYGVGIINNNDPKSWKYNRQFWNKTMLSPSFNNQAIEWANEAWEQMESYWNKLGENRELDLSKWVYRFTVDMVFRIATGVKNDAVNSYFNTLLLNDDINSLSEKEKENVRESEHFTHSIETFLRGLTFFFTLNKYTRRYVPFIREKVNAALENRDYLYDKMYSIINQRKIEIENTPSDQPLGHDMLTSFITANTSRDVNFGKHVDSDFLRPMTDQEIRGNLVDVMIGGTDTTANMLCFIIYYIEHNPEVKYKLRQELETVLGNDLTNPITFKNTEDLKYCEAIIKEVFRHEPVGFTLSRVIHENDKVGEYELIKDAQYQVLVSALMKHKDYWTDPEKFDPDRFYKVEESDKYLLEKKHCKDVFFMFGGGVRICPGRKLTIIELKCLISNIYRKYDVELVDMNAPLKYSNSTFFIFCDELPVRIKPRKF